MTSHPINGTHPGRLGRLPKPLSRIRWLLEYLGPYSPADVLAIVEHCRQQGTAYGCPRLAHRDRGPIEDLMNRPDI